MGDFPSGPLVKNPPANSWDTSSIPGPGGFHMPQGSSARESQLLSLYYGALELKLLSLHTLEPVLHKSTHHNEKPTQPN